MHWLYFPKYNKIKSISSIKKSPQIISYTPLWEKLNYLMPQSSIPVLLCTPCPAGTAIPEAWTPFRQMPSLGSPSPSCVPSLPPGSVLPQSLPEPNLDQSHWWTERTLRFRELPTTIISSYLLSSYCVPGPILEALYIHYFYWLPSPTISGPKYIY